MLNSYFVEDMFNKETFLEDLHISNPNEPEFLQAVTEVVTSLEDFLNENPQCSLTGILGIFFH